MTLLLTLLAAVVALVAGYAWGRRTAAGDAPREARPSSAASVSPPALASTGGPERAIPGSRPDTPPASAAIGTASTGVASAPPEAMAAPNDGASPAAIAERARLVRSFEGEAAALRRALEGHAGELAHALARAEDRDALHRDLAEARSQTDRYRTLVIDLEENAPPPILGSPGAPDDLKLIVGIGPVLERMLQQLGITTYRQIARWTGRDIDAFDARLPEFPGRIRRDAWVTQARALHLSKYGETLPPPHG